MGTQELLTDWLRAFKDPGKEKKQGGDRLRTPGTTKAMAGLPVLLQSVYMCVRVCACKGDTVHWLKDPGVYSMSLQNIQSAPYGSPGPSTHVIQGSLTITLWGSRAEVNTPALRTVKYSLGSSSHTLQVADYQ